MEPKFTILQGHVEEVLLFKKFFFLLSIHAFVAKIQPDKFVRWCPDGDFFTSFLRAVFSASRAQQVSDLHSKFPLRPHHVWKCVDIQSPTAEIRRGKKKKKPQHENIIWPVT